MANLSAGFSIEHTFIGVDLVSAAFGAGKYNRSHRFQVTAAIRSGYTAIATATSAPLFLIAPCAIAQAVAAETAPNVSRMSD